MQAEQFKSTTGSVLRTMLVTFAIVLTALSSASAQERPRTIFDLLFDQSRRNRNASMNSQNHNACALQTQTRTQGSHPDCAIC